jgi:Transcription antiterminator
MPKTWYAVHTIAGHENRVRDVLTRRAQVEGLWGYDIFQILIPTEREFTTRAGKRVEVDRKVFPGYILIEMNMTDDAYKLVKSTSGVTGFVQSGNKPVPLEDYEVTRIMKNLEKSKEAPKIAWQKGTRFECRRTVRRLLGQDRRSQLRPRTAQGTDQHLWARHSGRIGIHASRETVSTADSGARR